MLINIIGGINEKNLIVAHFNGLQVLHNVFSHPCQDFFERHNTTIGGRLYVSKRVVQEASNIVAVEMSGRWC